MAELEKKRGALLAKRLRLLNEFIIGKKGTDILFGEFLKSKGWNEAKFNKELPEALVIPGIVNARAESETLMEYTQAMNLWYADQYIRHVLKSNFSVEGAPLRCAVVMPQEQYYNAKGRLKDKIKEKFKDAKEKIKSAFNSVKDKVSSGADKIKDKIQRGKVVGQVNRFNPVVVAMRGAFLSLVNINAAGLASAISHIRRKGGTHWNKLVKKWEILGGEKGKLESAVDKGKTKKAFPRLKINRRSSDGTEEILDENAPKNAAKAAAGAAGALVGLAGVLASNPATAPAAVYVGSAAGALAVVGPILKQFAASQGVDVSGIIDLPSAGLDAETEASLQDADQDAALPASQTIWDKYKIAIYIGGGIMVATGISAIIVLASKKK